MELVSQRSEKKFAPTSQNIEPDNFKQSPLKPKHSSRSLTPQVLLDKLEKGKIVFKRKSSSGKEKFA